MMQFATSGEGRAWKERVEVKYKIGCAATYRVCMFAFAWNTLAICAVLLGGGAQPVRASQPPATVRHITVSGDDHDLAVEITATRATIPRTQTVTGPDRLIVDLPDARPDAGLQKIPINRGKVKDVRVGLLSANPPITRVVLDLMAPTEYRVTRLANTIVVKLGNEPAPAAAVPTTEPSAEAQPEETASVAQTPPPPQPEPSRARWILPILVMATVMAMLVIAVVAHLQNRRDGRGL